jgi:N-methylhydantoinase A/acetophenone carboxylase
VNERIDSQGNVLIPLREDEVRVKIQELVDMGVEGIAVCLLWSCSNPVHERMIGDIARAAFPNVEISLSCEICPKWHEYPRANVTILTAYLGPGMREHFGKVEKKLQSLGYRRPLFIVNNAGGIGGITHTQPSDTCRSGPVAGLLGSAILGETYGYKNIITTDMGGTSFDLGIILDGKTPFYVWRPVIDRWLTELSMLEVKILGAGGGSIAWINKAMGGRLECGPQSAGAVPGPACYDRGGEEATVTDADLVLGYINPDYFWGGRMKLNAKKAVETIRKKVADPLKMDLYEAAMGIRKVIDAKMGNEIYKETVLRGYDPRNFVMFAFGGAGPTHCCGYNEYIGVVGCPKIVTFPASPEFCALGAGLIDASRIFEQSRRVELCHPVTRKYLSDPEEFNAVVRRLEAQARETMKEDGFDERSIVFTLELDMRFGVQVYLTRIVSPRMYLQNEEDARAVCEQFTEVYSKKYSKDSAQQEAGISIENFCLRALVRRAKPQIPRYKYLGENSEKALKGVRKVFWNSGFEETPVYAYERLVCGNVVKGSAIIESIDTTYVIPKRMKFTVDEFLNGVIEKF